MKFNKTVLHAINKNFLLFSVVLVVLALILNWVWLLIVNFDPTPIATIDTIIVVNLLLTFFTSKKVPLAGGMLLWIIFLSLVLGFSLLRAQLIL